MLTMEERISLVALTATIGEQEADRLWKRYGIMLTLNAGLLAIVSFTASNKMNVFSGSIAVLGLVVSVCWYRMVSLSQFYEARWRKDLGAVIDADPVLTVLLRSRSRLGPRTQKPIRGSSTGNAKFLVVLAGGLWIALAAFSIIAELKPTANSGAQNIGVVSAPTPPALLATPRPPVPTPPPAPISTQKP